MNGPIRKTCASYVNLAAVVAVFLAYVLAMPIAAAAQSLSYSNDEIADAYIYLLGRLYVTRQQQLDFTEGFEWNEFVHRKPGAVDWPNPNLDVAYSEAWVAVDETSCTIVSVPEVKDRYYTVQFLNGWGETLANINERLFPHRPSGDFAACLEGSDIKLPEGTLRIDLPVKHARILARVALGDDWDGAVALQHEFGLKATGTPTLPDIPVTPIFDLETFPGIEAFDAAEAALDSEPDINPGLEEMADRARKIAEVTGKGSKNREHVAEIIRTVAIPKIGKAGAIIGHGVIRNGWARPGVVGEYGVDWLTRTLVDYRGLWANVKPEVLYYRGGSDSSGAELNGDNAYTLTFPKDALPSRFAKYFWSVIAVDSKRFRVLPNPQNRFLLNEASKPEYGDDGSLTLYFAAEKPKDAPEGNWLPTPHGQTYRLTFRYYGPLDGVANGTYWPPALMKVNR